MSSADQLASGVLTPGLILDVLLKLGIVLILVYLSLRLLRRYAQQAPILPPDHPHALPARLNVRLAQLFGQSGPALASPIHTLQVHPLNRQVTLYLIECEGRRLLLSVSNQQAQLLSEWPAPLPNSDRNPDMIPGLEQIMSESSKSQVQGEQL